jgi:hypothetical protein
LTYFVADRYTIDRFLIDTYETAVVPPTRGVSMTGKRYASKGAIKSGPLLVVLAESEFATGVELEN